MRIEALAIQGFRVFTRDTVVRFPKGNGLYMVRGVNNAHPEMGPNGVGKSTIWDALSWVFYGASTRRLKSKPLANWSESHPMSVVCDFVLDRTAYSVTRTYTSPITLTLQKGAEDPQAVSQQELIDLIGLDHTTFLATVLHPQLGDSFLLLEKAKKLERFSTVLQLDKWLDFSQQARDRASRLESEAQETDREIARLTGTLEQQTRHVQSLEALSEAFESSRVREVAQIQKSVDAGREGLQRVEKALARAVERVEEIGDWIDACEHSLAKLERRRLAAERDAKEAASRLHKIDAQLDHIGKTLHGLATLRGIECPACRQEVPETHVDETIKGLEEQAKELQEKARPDRDAHNIATRTQLEVVRERTERQKTLAIKRRSYEAAQVDVRKAERLVDQERASLASGIARLREWQDKDNPHEAQTVTARKARKSTRGRLRKLKRSHDRELAKAHLYRTLQKEFKDLRLAISRDAMQEFAVVMMSVLDQLGLRGWEVRCDIEQPSGRSTAKGFLILIKSPEAPDWIPVESWCGGETQRLAVATDVAYSDLACGATGFSPSCEVWDEPTRGLSSEGVEDLLRFLADRARRRNRAVFVVDHHKHESAQVAGEYQVIRNDVSVDVLSSIETKHK